MNCNGLEQLSSPSRAEYACLLLAKNAEARAARRSLLSLLPGCSDARKGEAVYKSC